jgi:ferredoxin
MSACPVGAYSKRPDGPVIYNPNVCIGCRYCMNACAFGVPHFDYDRGIIDGAFIDKCTLCPQRIDNGLEPACVATCPTDALEYGDRTELIARAHARIREHPDRYIDHVYGEHDKGGTSYLVISHVPFKELGLPEMDPEPINEITESIMEGTIPFALGWAGVLTATAFGVRAVKKTMVPASPVSEPAQETESEK